MVDLAQQMLSASELFLTDKNSVLRYVKTLRSQTENIQEIQPW